jgi:hypothetical protein
MSGRNYRLTMTVLFYHRSMPSIEIDRDRTSDWCSNTFTVLLKETVDHRILKKNLNQTHGRTNSHIYHISMNVRIA